MPQIEVTFDIDANGIVNVSAKDRGTGKSQEITITASSGLAKEEVERMVDDAQSHADEDKVRREEIEARNRVDTLVYATDKTLRENRDKLPEADVSAVEKAIEEARKALDEGGKERLERAAQDLTQASHRLAEVLYQKASGSPPPETNAPGSERKDGGDGDVIDAEVVDKG
jgi:molecular chaperone DnaK